MAKKEADKHLTDTNIQRHTQSEVSCSSKEGAQCSLKFSPLNTSELQCS